MKILKSRVTLVLLAISPWALFFFGVIVGIGLVVVSAPTEVKVIESIGYFLSSVCAMGIPSVISPFLIILGVKLVLPNAESENKWIGILMLLSSVSFLMLMGLLSFLSEKIRWMANF